eukprot:2262768-Pyramimonas_sp.AAC.1
MTDQGVAAPSEGRELGDDRARGTRKRRKVRPGGAGDRDDAEKAVPMACLLYTSPSPRDRSLS